MTKSYLLFMEATEMQRLKARVKQPKKTKLVAVMSKEHGEWLALIKWHPSWRQYVFKPLHDTIWNPSCLREVCRYIEKLMQERRTQ